MKKTTTLRELIKNINFDNKQMETHPDWEELSKVFDIYELYWSDDTRLRAFFIETWHCTDSWVGMRAYFLDEEFVAISTQTARKSDEDFSFASKSAAEKVENYLRSLVKENREEPVYDIIEDSELDKEISPTYKIEYNTQILHKTALLNGERVKFIKKHYPYDSKDSFKHFHVVEIEHSNGKREEIDCRKLDFEYNTLN
jgi:hypothetical protein